jgi:putative tricarboxylic transport membrane protein
MYELLTGAGSAIFATLAIASGSCVAADWRPERNIEIIVGTAPGSNQDLTARRMHKAWQDQKLIPVPQIISNKPGAGGELGWTYLARFSADGHYLAMTSPSMLSNQLLGKSRLTLADVTPLALLVREYETFSVKGDHAFKSLNDLSERLRKDPASVTFGFGVATGNAQHVTGALYGKALGVDARRMKMVVFNASAEAMTTVMGGHVDVLITSTSVIESPVRAGQLRVLAVAAPARLAGIFSGVPTFKESGVDLVFSNWNGVVGTKGLTPLQIAYWDGIFARTTANPEWQRTMAEQQQDATYLDSQTMKGYMEREREQYRASLQELGLIKSP